MLQRDERETEILLGNKQLLGIFSVGAILLGLAFAGGYMVGRNAMPKKAALTATAGTDTTATETATNTPGQVGETHSVNPEETANLAPEPVRDEELGRSKKKASASIAPLVTASADRQDAFTPQSGQEFLQVTAVQRDHAMAVASVLRKKGFRAHAVANPKNPNVYRVIVGPIRNAGELSSTRDSLRKTGFNQVLVQHYQ